MTLEIPTGFAHIAIEHRATGDPEPWYVTFGIAVPSPLFADACDYAQICYRTFVESRLGNHVTVTGANLVVGTDAEPLRMFSPYPDGAYVGDRSTASLPQNCALLIDKNTALGGRRNQGRFFLPGCLAEGDVDNVGVITSSVVTAWQTAAGLFLSALADSTPLPDLDDAPMVILHNNSGTPPAAPTPVVSLSVQTNISTQRRRLR